MSSIKVAYKQLDKDLLQRLFWGFQPTTDSEYQKVVQITKDFMSLSKVHRSNSDTEHFVQLAEFGHILKSTNDTTEIKVILSQMSLRVNMLKNSEEKLTQ
jgi:hypothetical protein